MPDGLGLDWYRASFPFEKRDDVLAVIDQWENLRKVEGKGWWGYETKWQSEDSKSSVHFSRGFTSKARPECCLDLNGAFMSRLGASEQWGLVRVLRALGARNSRLDVAFDDSEKIVRPSTVFEAYEAGCCVGFGYRDFFNGGKGKGKGEGTTTHLGKQGSEGSGKFFAIYDKDHESKGRIDAVRWELRLFGERALSAGMVMAETPSLGAFRDLLGGLIVGAVDFRNREAVQSKNLDRVPRLPWWEKIVGKLAKAERVRVVKEDKSLDEAAEWAMKTWAKTYAKLKLWHEKHNGGIGFDLFLDAMFRKGEESLSPDDRKQIERGGPPDLDIPF